MTLSALLKIMTIMKVNDLYYNVILWDREAFYTNYTPSCNSIQIDLVQWTLQYRTRNA